MFPSIAVALELLLTVYEIEKEMFSMNHTLIVYKIRKKNISKVPQSLLTATKAVLNH